MAEEQEFKVTDRRGFTEDGKPKPVEEKPAEAPATKKSTVKQGRTSKRAEASKNQKKE